MKNAYLEFLVELYISLEKSEPSMWSDWMKKSIDKFNVDENISYFLSSFGGMGSFSDYIIEDDVTNELRNITYSCACAIRDNGNKEINDILLEEKGRLNRNIINFDKERNNFYMPLELSSYINMLNYVNEICDNYTGGNLHEITTNYLNKKCSTKQIINGNNIEKEKYR